MELRLYQAQTNERERTANGIGGCRIEAGDFMIQRQTEQGEWQNFEGPYAPHERSTAQARLKQLQDAELPQIFDE